MAEASKHEWRDQFMASVASPWYVERLFDRLPDIVFSIKDRQGRYVSISETAAVRCGLKHRTDAIGTTAYDLFPKPMADRYTRQDERLFRTGKPIIDNLDLTVYRDGSAGWCLSTKEPLRDANGGIVGLACISKDLTEPSRAGLIDAALADTIDHVLAHLDEPLRIEALAQRAGLSQAKFDRRMKKIFQVSAGHYVIKARIDQATRLLAAGDTAIAEIAQHCGFSDQSAFTRQFRHVTGLTPGQYRQLLRGGLSVGSGARR
ncbi:MAG TPA: AraC family transcriptional regulator [Chiayiivirga sp.]|nr:AraC family transcriptional regulator [Chiayiivirga sp.]